MRILGTVTVVFFLSWLPFQIANLTLSIEDVLHDIPDEKKSYYLHWFSVSHLACMTSVLTNPILYGLLNSNYKRGIVLLMRVCTRESASRRSTTRDDRVQVQETRL